MSLTSEFFVIHVPSNFSEPVWLSPRPTTLPHYYITSNSIKMGRKPVFDAARIRAELEEWKRDEKAIAASDLYFVTLAAKTLDATEVISMVDKGEFYLYHHESPFFFFLRVDR